MLFLNEIKKNPEGLVFSEILDIKEELCARNPEVIGIDNVKVDGRVTYDDGFYLLDYQLSYEITLPSSRSMKPVAICQEESVSEAFITLNEYEGKKDIIDEMLALIVEGDAINLKESVIDNILLSIPLRILAEDEKDKDTLPTGESWSVLTEEQYEAMKTEKKKENNPFSALDGLF